MGFLTDYFEIEDLTTEVAVCCPFPHFTASGLPYKETNPSAHINTDENLFHCKVCGIGYSELQFIQKIFDCKYIDAKKLQALFNKCENIDAWKEEQLSPESKTLANKLGISEKVLNELQVKTSPESIDNLSFPVFMYDKLLDVRVYKPNHKPKIKSRSGAMSGLVMPYDIWRTSKKSIWTVLCAGEKDMAIARTMGFNAITLVGGENTLPKLPKMFEGRKVAICYDNDEAGKVGANKVAQAILPYAEQVKVITAFHQGMENKEDITDYFIKYKHTKQDLIKCILDTPDAILEETSQQNHYKQMDLLTASRPENVSRLVQSNIQIVAVADTTFTVPSTIIAEKFKEDTGINNMTVGECKQWDLSEDTCQDILHLMDNNFTEATINKNIKDMLHILQKEKYIKIRKPETATIFKSVVTDLFETSNTSSAQPMEYTVYSINKKLESGQKYMVTYKLVPHPYKGQQLTMIVVDASQANDSVSDFKLDDNTKSSLRLFQELPDNLIDRMQILTNKVKGLLGYDGNDQLIQTIDLAYHTVLQFNFGTFKNVRGYLDTIVVGESRVGKSSTADCLRKTYGLGTFTSLAGNSATVPGLVGGSNKTGGGYQTRAGIIPQNHKGLIIFEEFGKSNSSVITELTDIRSSNEVRITRVAGTITLPAIVRMIALTNPKSRDGSIKPIAAYPNGIAVLTELVSSAEDIARYDLIAILGDRGNLTIDPLWQPDEPLPEEAYRARVRWVWSRTPEQVIIDETVQRYIVDTANKLNMQYDCHIKIFGTEAWKKITRLAIAVAGYTVSTDETYENIIVTKDHVTYAAMFLQSLYDNPVFKLREYVAFQKQYSVINEDGITALQDIYDAYPTLIMHLEQQAYSTKSILGSCTGLDNNELNKATNKLAKGLFVTFNGNEIVPTERFRKGMNKLNRNTYVSRVGEQDAEIQVDEYQY